MNLANARKHVYQSLKHPGDLNKGWDGFKDVDPLFTSGLKNAVRIEDESLAKIWEGVGNDKLQNFHDKDAGNMNRSLLHRAMAGLAYLGGSALAGGGGSTAGGATAGGEASAAPAASEVGSTSATSSGSSGWQRLMQMGQSMGGGGGGQQNVEQDPVVVDRTVLPGCENVTSSKSANTDRRPVDEESAVTEELQRNNPIDDNGVTVLGIQELTGRIAEAKKRLAQLQGSKS